MIKYIFVTYRFLESPDFQPAIAKKFIDQKFVLSVSFSALRIRIIMDPNYSKKIIDVIIVKYVVYDFYSY